MEFDPKWYTLYRVLLAVHLNLLSVNDDALVVGLDGGFETTVSRIILELVLEILQIHVGVVDGGNLDSGVSLEGSPEHEPTDATKTVDSKHIYEDIIIE